MVSLQSSPLMVSRGGIDDDVLEEGRGGGGGDDGAEATAAISEGYISDFL